MQRDDHNLPNGASATRPFRFTDLLKESGMAGLIPAEVRQQQEAEDRERVKAAEEARKRIEEEDRKWREDAPKREAEARQRAKAARNRMLEQAGYSGLAEFGCNDEDIRVEWAVDGMIPESGITGLYGRPESFKSFLALHLAACISSGQPFLGRETCPSRRLDGEQPPEVFYHWGEGTADLDARVNEGLTEEQFRAAQLRIRRKKGLDLSDREQVQELARLIGGWPVVIFDTVKDYIPGGYENYLGISRAFQNLIEWADEWTACVILIAHSSTKGDGRSVVGTDEWLRSVDTQIQVSRRGKELGGTLSCDKIRQGPVFGPVPFVMKRTAHSLRVGKPAPPKLPKDEVIERLRVLHEGDKTLSAHALARLLGNDSGYTHESLRRFASAEVLPKPRKPVTSKGKGRLRSV
jgi:hypothetical protein